MSKKKRVEPIPEEFSSYEEAAEFWDTHATTDYPDAFRTVKVVSEIRQRRYEIEIDEDLVRPLRARARKKRVTPSHLASHIPRERLASSKWSFSRTARHNCRRYLVHLGAPKGAALRHDVVSVINARRRRKDAPAGARAAAQRQLVQAGSLYHQEPPGFMTWAGASSPAASPARRRRHRSVR